MPLFLAGFLQKLPKKRWKFISKYNIFQVQNDYEPSRKYPRIFGSPNMPLFLTFHEHEKNDFRPIVYRGYVFFASRVFSMSLRFAAKNRIFTQIHSNASFSLMISVINSRHLCAKPPTPLKFQFTLFQNWSKFIVLFLISFFKNDRKIAFLLIKTIENLFWS